MQQYVSFVIESIKKVERIIKYKKKKKNVYGIFMANKNRKKQGDGDT